MEVLSFYVVNNLVNNVLIGCGSIASVVLSNGIVVEKKLNVCDEQNIVDVGIEMKADPVSDDVVDRPAVRRIKQYLADQLIQHVQIDNVNSISSDVSQKTNGVGKFGSYYVQDAVGVVQDAVAGVKEIKWLDMGCEM